MILQWYTVLTLTTCNGIERPIQYLATSAEEALEKANKDLDRDFRIPAFKRLYSVFFIVGVWNNESKFKKRQGGKT